MHVITGDVDWDQQLPTVDLRERETLAMHP